MTPATVAAVAAAVLGAGALGAALWRNLRKLSKAADQWNELVVLVRPDVNGRTMMQRVTTIEGQLATLVRQGEQQ